MSRFSSGNPEDGSDLVTLFRQNWRNRVNSWQERLVSSSKPLDEDLRDPLRLYMYSNNTNQDRLWMIKYPMMGMLIILLMCMISSMTNIP